MDALQTAQALGFTLPSPAYILGAILFGLLGFAAWRFGKHRQRATTKWLGVALMFYPYAVPNTVWLWLVGLALCGAVYWDNR